MRALFIFITEKGEKNYESWLVVMEINPNNCGI